MTSKSRELMRRRVLIAGTGFLAGVIADFAFHAIGDNSSTIHNLTQVTVAIAVGGIVWALLPRWDQ